MKKKLILLIDAIFLARPILLIPVISFCALGYMEKSPDRFFTLSLSFDFALNTLFLSLMLMAVHVINRIADKDSDEINSGPAAISLKTETVRLAQFIATILIIASIGLSASISGLTNTFFVVVSLIVGLMYSIKPFYLTGRPFADFLCNGLGYGIICVFVGIASAENHLINPHNIASYFLLMSAGSIASTTPDTPGDSKTGKITTAVFLGEKKALTLGIFFLIVALALGVYEGNIVVIITSICSLAALIFAIVKPSKVSYSLSYQVGGGILMALIHVKMPLLFVVSLLLWGITFLYYRLRFSQTYPAVGK